MKKTLLALTVSLGIAITPTFLSAAEISVQTDREIGIATENARQMMTEAFLNMQEEAQQDPVRQKEVSPEEMSITSIDEETEELIDMTINACTIEMDGRQMHYTMEVIGEPDENGLYPLYIALHGGGGGDPEENNEQWDSMSQYYRGSITSGIYVAPRGMEDVWNLHFLEESYPMYDRLIEDMILLKKADPNRVYLLGFSAGGDGVYQVAPRMADRFAAANMSSGHPNGVSLLNTSVLPFQIQVGIRDFYTEDVLRSVRGAEFEKVLNEYHETYGFGYPHRVLVHVPEGHNYNDYSDESSEGGVLVNPTEFAERCVEEDWLGSFLDLYASFGNEYDVMDLSYAPEDDFNEALKKYITDELGMDVDYNTNTNAVNYVNQYTRNPYPEQLVWDLSTRAASRHDTGFYWLKTDYSVNKGVVDSKYNAEDNTVILRGDDSLNGVEGNISILANPFMMDFDRPLTIVTPNEEYTVDLKADENVIRNSLHETGDIHLSWAQEINVPIEKLY